MFYKTCGKYSMTCIATQKEAVTEKTIFHDIFAIIAVILVWRDSDSPAICPVVVIQLWRELTHLFPSGV